MRVEGLRVEGLRVVGLRVEGFRVEGRRVEGSRLKIKGVGIPEYEGDIRTVTEVALHEILVHGHRRVQILDRDEGEAHSPHDLSKIVVVSHIVSNTTKNEHSRHNLSLPMVVRIAFMT